MSKHIFDDPNDFGFDDLGRINDEGLVDVESPADNPVLFEDQFEMRSRELQASPPRMQTVDIFPTKKGPWSGNNQLGIQQPFAPDANNLQTILKLDEWGFPAPWTVTLGLDYEVTNWDSGGVLRSFEVTALIAFGVGGVTQELELDWLCGNSITLVMNAVNIRALYSRPFAGEGSALGDIPDDLKLRVTLSRGPIIHGRPTRSYMFPGDTGSFPPVTDSGNGNMFPDTGIRIPPFAKGLSIIGGTLDSSAFDFYTQSAGSIIFTSDPLETTESLVVSPTSIVSRMPLSQFVNYLDIVNGSIGHPTIVPIPPFARAIHLVTQGTDDGGIRGCVVQFLLGL